MFSVLVEYNRKNDFIKGLIHFVIEDGQKAK